MKCETEFEAEWSSYEWLLVADLERGDMEQFNHRLGCLRGSLAILGCKKEYREEQIRIRVEDLYEYISLRRGAIKQ